MYSRRCTKNLYSGTEQDTYFSHARTDNSVAVKESEIYHNRDDIFLN